MCTGPRTLLHLLISNARRGFPRHGGWCLHTHLFNVAHFRARTKTSRILVRQLLFADDSAPIAHSAGVMQKIVDAFSDVSKKFGLKLNIKKTDITCPTVHTQFGHNLAFYCIHSQKCSGQFVKFYFISVTHKTFSILISIQFCLNQMTVICHL